MLIRFHVQIEHVWFLCGRVWCISKNKVSPQSRGNRPRHPKKEFTVSSSEVTMFESIKSRRSPRYIETCFRHVVKKQHLINKSRHEISQVLCQSCSQWNTTRDCWTHKYWETALIVKTDPMGPVAGPKNYQKLEAIGWTVNSTYFQNP